MQFSDRYPIIVTNKKNAARDFWIRHFGFEAIFDSTWFCLLTAEGNTASIAFMTPDHPSAPLVPKPLAELASVLRWKSRTQKWPMMS